MSPNNNKNRDDRPHGNHNNAKRTFFPLRLDRTTSYYYEDEFEAVGAAAGERRMNTALFGTLINSSSRINTSIVTTRQRHQSSLPSPRSSISTPTSMMPLFSDNLVTNSKEIQMNININAAISDYDNDANYGRINRSESKAMLPYMPMFDDGEESFCSDECDENENENLNQNCNKFTIDGNDASEGGIRVSSYLPPGTAPPGVVVVLDGSPLFPHQDADTNEESNYKMSINKSDDNNKSLNNTRSRLAIHRALSFDDVNFDDFDYDDNDDEDDIEHQQECDLSFTIPITGTSSGGRNRSNFLYHVS
jgi:hypothetical protein